MPLLRADEAIATMQIAPGFRIETVAEEPLVQHPVAMTFDPDGRIWVVEMRSYMPDVEGNGENAPTGRVKMLEDLDGDGRMDKSTVFLDQLVLPRAVGLVRDGVLVAAPPKLLFCRDTDGDGRSDEQTVIADDYGIRGNPEQWGIAQDDFGRLFHNTNTNQLRGSLIAPHYADRNPYYRTAVAVNEQIARDQSVFPAHATAVDRGYLEKIMRPDGTLRAFTAACAPLIYRGGLFPREFHHNAFVCEPAANLIKRNIVTEREDGSLSAKHAYQNDEFLRSTYERFRPVNLNIGPDGAIYIVDMHHGLIQHKTYLTTYCREQYEAKELNKHMMTGRLYRIVPESAKPASPPNLSKATTPQLVEHLGHANGWWRDTAQRLLVDRGEVKSLALLRRAAMKQEPRRLARIILHGVTGPITVDGETHNLDMPGLGKLSDEEIAAVMTYTRRAWNHTASPVAPAEVAAVRATTRPTPWTERELLKTR